MNIITEILTHDLDLQTCLDMVKYNQRALISRSKVTLFKHCCLDTQSDTGRIVYSCIAPLLFYSRIKIYLFHKSFSCSSISTP